MSTMNESPKKPTLTVDTTTTLPPKPVSEVEIVSSSNDK